MSQVTITENASFKKEDQDSLDQIWLQPLKYMKRIPNEISELNVIKIGIHVLKIPEDKIVEADSIMRNVFYGILLLDDIQDNSTLRDNIPVTNSVYGIPSTMNTLFYVFLHSAKRILNYHPDALLVLIQELPQILIGQETEMQWEKTLTCPTEEEFFNQVDQKAGCILRTYVGLLQLHGENKYEVSHVCRLTGIFLQVTNDYLNYKDEDYAAFKGYCEDLTQGKYTYPIVYAVANYPKEGQEILSILHQKTDDVELKKHCVDLLEKCGIFKHVVDFLKNLRKEIITEIEKIGDSDAAACGAKVLDYWGKKVL